jgi:hypothetical protein
VGDEKVASADVESVQNWLEEYPDAIHRDERGYIETGDDLIYVLPKTRRPLLQGIFCKLLVHTGIFRRVPTDKTAYDPRQSYLQDKARADRFLAWIMVPFGLFMLIGPLWILYVVHNAERRLGIITGFVVLFAALVFLSTSARTYEGLAATAG